MDANRAVRSHGRRVEHEGQSIDGQPFGLGLIPHPQGERVRLVEQVPVVGACRAGGGQT